MKFSYLGPCAVLAYKKWQGIQQSSLELASCMIMLFRKYLSQYQKDWFYGPIGKAITSLPVKSKDCIQEILKANNYCCAHSAS